MGTKNFQIACRRTFPAFAALLILAGLIPFAVSGCGGSSGTTGSSSTPEPSTAEQAKEASAEGQTNEASAEFLRPKSETNKYVKFGEEAPVSVRDEASEVLTQNLEAREEADFATQCATLSKSSIEEVTEEKAAKASANCPLKLRKLAEPLTKTEKFRANPLSGPIAVLRMKSTRAFALFHGAQDDDYAMPMFKEDDEWKVGSIVTIELPKK